MSEDRQMSTQSLQNKPKPSDALRRYNDFNVTKQKRYLKVLEETGNRKTAAASVGVEDDTVQALASRNPTFYKRAKQAETKFLSMLEEETVRRAVTGTEKAIYYKGEHVATETQYSDKLLELLLKANDRDKYGNKSQVDNNTTINVNDTTLRSKLATSLGIKLEKAPTPLEEDAIDAD